MWRGIAARRLSHPVSQRFHGELEYRSPNARFRVLQLLKTNFHPGDKLTHVSTGTPYVYALGFTGADGKHKLLLVNKRDREFNLTLSAGFAEVDTSTRPPKKILRRNSTSKLRNSLYADFPSLWRAVNDQAFRVAHWLVRHRS